MEGLMLKLKLQYFGHLMYTDDSLETSLMLGKIKGRRRASEDEMAGQHHRFNEHELGQTPGDDEGQGGLVCYSPWVTKSWTWLNNNRAIRKYIMLCGHKRHLI